MRQQGNCTLGIVLMLLLLGGVTLHATRNQLSRSMVLVLDEQRYHRDFWQAQSALQWGLTQSWPQTAGWRCQRWPAQLWQSCLLRMGNNNALLSGRGEEGEFWLWRWVLLQGNRAQSLVHGWLDYCPLAKPEHCQPSGGTAGF